MNDEQPSGGFLERLRNSPRTVSTIIVILIIAGAIFAFSDRGTSPSPTPPAAAEDVEETGAAGEAGDQPAEAAQNDDAAAGDVEEPAPAAPDATPLPEPTETADAFGEVANPGEGVTHLARRSAARYLEGNPSDFTVTNEHRVFIEDYLKDRDGSRFLEIGETVTFSKNTIREAVEASRELTDAQLRNLQTYAQRVQWQ